MANSMTSRGRVIAGGSGSGISIEGITGTSSQIHDAAWV
jgi:hypothetical protein